MTTYNSNTQVPIVKQINTVFSNIPNIDLLNALKAPTGKKSYGFNISLLNQALYNMPVRVLVAIP